MKEAFPSIHTGTLLFFQSCFFSYCQHASRAARFQGSAYDVLPEETEREVSRVRLDIVDGRSALYESAFVASRRFKWGNDEPLTAASTQGTLYDLHLGALSGETSLFPSTLCKTCGLGFIRCPGHFGNVGGYEADTLEKWDQISLERPDWDLDPVLREIRSGFQPHFPCDQMAVYDLVTFVGNPCVCLEHDAPVVPLEWVLREAVRRFGTFAMVEVGYILTEEPLGTVLCLCRCFFLQMHVLVFFQIHLYRGWRMRHGPTGAVMERPIPIGNRRIRAYRGFHTL